MRRTPKTSTGGESSKALEVSLAEEVVTQGAEARASAPSEARDNRVLHPEGRGRSYQNRLLPRRRVQAHRFAEHEPG